MKDKNLKGWLYGTIDTQSFIHESRFKGLWATTLVNFLIGWEVLQPRFSSLYLVKELFIVKKREFERGLFLENIILSYILYSPAVVKALI